MNVIDVHPDDLFDRELAGTLTDEERARLDAHVAKCEACRLERQLRADFRAEEELQMDAPGEHPDDLFDLELAGTLSPVQRKTLDAHVSQCGVCAIERQLRADFGAELGASEQTASLLGEVRVSPLATAERTKEAPRRSLSIYGAGSSRRKLQWALAAAMVVGTSMAAAGSPKVVAAFQAAVEEVRSVVAPKRVAGNGSAAKGASALPPVASPQRDPSLQESPSQEPPSQEPPAAVPVIEPIAAPNVSPEAIDPESSLHEAPRALAPVTEPARAISPPPRAPKLSDSANGITPSKASTVAMAPAQTAPIQSTQVAPVQTALVEPVRASDVEETSATLFSSAARARKQGDVPKALAMYEALQFKFPLTPEARVSHVMLGRLAYESHDDVRALKAFDAYLVSGDKALREDALVGAARASERTRLQGKERDMWTQLLRECPNSSFADQAARRILELGAAAK